MPLARLVVGLSIFYRIWVTKNFLVFPTGITGAALLLLRLVTTGELAEATLSTGSSSIWIWATLVVLAVMLMCGISTRSASAITSLVLLAACFQVAGDLQWLRLLGGLGATCLTLLGPGGYSIDSRRFGRRVINLGK